jgi:hypothetical protein
MFGRANDFVIAACVGWGIGSIMAGDGLNIFIAFLVSIYTGVWHRLFWPDLWSDPRP